MLCTRLALLRARLRQAPDEWSVDACWQAMEKAMEASVRVADPGLAAIILGQDAEALDRLLAGWREGSTPLCPADQRVVVAALQTFATERASRAHGAVEPPGAFPAEVWDLLVSRGRLVRTAEGKLRAPAWDEDT